MYCEPPYIKGTSVSELTKLLPIDAKPLPRAAVPGIPEDTLVGSRVVHIDVRSITNRVGHRCRKVNESQGRQALRANPCLGRNTKLTAPRERLVMLLHIEDGEPATWQDLEISVARILFEAGLRAERNKTVETVRGNVAIDVYAEDHTTTPPNIMLIECKHWRSAVPQNVVHGSYDAVSWSALGSRGAIGTAMASQALQALARLTAAPSPEVADDRHRRGDQSDYLARCWTHAG